MREKLNYKLGSRLATLRNEKGYTQQEFCNAFAEFCGTTAASYATTVSAWEQNHRYPTMNNIVQLAMFYNTSLDYLFGLSEEKYKTSGTSINRTNTVIADQHVIKHVDYPIYDGFPVYISFKDNEYLNQWGILNQKKNKVMCKDFAISLTLDANLHSMSNDLPFNRISIPSVQGLMENEMILIEMKSADPAVCKTYNGRYRHNELKTMLINVTNGLTLPYTGLGLSFIAFRG